MNLTTNQSLTIGEVAKRSGVGVETVRFYEREGLIAEPPRKASGYRQYPLETVDRIRFTRRAKELGFTLQEIKELFSLRLAPETTCEDIRNRAEDKILEVEKKITQLTQIKKALKTLTRACEESASIRECPILEALDKPKQP